MFFKQLIAPYRTGIASVMVLLAAMPVLGLSQSIVAPALTPWVKKMSKNPKRFHMDRLIVRVGHRQWVGGLDVSRLFRSKPVTVHPIPRVQPSPSISSSTLTLLAEVVMAEAGNQPEAAQIGVADVVLHRTRTPGFPQTISAVLYQPGQFDSVMTGMIDRVVPSPQVWAATRAALAGVNVVPGAVYFDTPSEDAANPWSHQLVGCREIGAMRFCQGIRSSS
ncbi:hypothetical protein TPY_2708 [Sulfobacillus acidophilus TPY]|uniref:Cell wall hydrolase SleB n=1 Tax=Sulfobacillus acidophilus (strain ATCC 700253 / DSM 10332 / NAL) TaxID=679936 RepID=G8TUM5_SULAD|nr:hypothetical protein TPY_2708 [Sulfobacillus acidophilus TPY]AEW04672.1 cell wall hydrolase SleB [Sulfobacillus acidophilus DSM 10332]